MMILMHVSCVGCDIEGNKCNSNGEKREHEQDGIGWWDTEMQPRGPPRREAEYHNHIMQMPSLLSRWAKFNSNDTITISLCSCCMTMTHNSTAGTHVSKKITNT